MDRDKMMAKLKEKAGKSKMSDEYFGAKKGLLQSLVKQMGSAAGDRVKKLKEVSVMADSDSGLKEGLDKAKEILRGDPGGHDEFKETPVDEAEESSQMQKMEDDTGTEMHDGKEMEDGPGMDSEGLADIEKQIAALMKKKASLGSK